MSETPATNLSATQLRILFAPRGDVFHSVMWSPDSRMIATGSDDSNIRLWNIESGELVRTLVGHQGPVRSVAWSGDGQWLASGADDRTVRVWEVTSGRLVHTLEGHRSLVRSVAWSRDGRWLASGANDRTVRVWDMESGTELAVYQHRYASAYNVLDISFVPGTPVIAVFGKTRLGEDDVLVETPGLELHTPTSTLSPTSYVSAKIVLVGESNVGKSCLALRLAQDRYEEQGTTHGMRLWTMSPEQLSPAMATPHREKREVVIWDLGGQDEYRLVHQLFLHDTTLALILLDPTRGSRAFEDVREWNLRLEKQLRGRAAIKLLVGAKLDSDQPLIDTVGLERLVKECACHVISQQVRKSPTGSIRCVQQLPKPLIGASYRRQPGHASSNASVKSLTSGDNEVTLCCFTPNWRDRYTKRSRMSLIPVRSTQLLSSCEDRACSPKRV